MTEPIEAAGLLSCPFCTSQDVVCVDQGDDDFAVVCKSCGASSKFDDNASEAMAAWNRRPAASGDLRERIARIVEPGAFHEEAIDRHKYCSPRRVDVVQAEALTKADAILSTIAPDEAAIRAAAFEEAAKIVTSRVEGMELQRFVFNGVTSTDTRGNDLFIAKSDVEKLLNDRAATIRSQEAGR